MTNLMRGYVDVHKLMDSCRDVICAFDNEGRFLFASAAALQIWGYSPEELIGKHSIDFVAPEDQSRTAATAESLMAGADISFFENHFIHKDGTLVPLLWTYRWDAAEQICYCAAKDATERKKVEKDAELNAQRIARAYSVSNIGWWEWNVKEKAGFVSDELFDIYGLDKSTYNQISPDFFLSLVHPNDLQIVKQHIEAIYQHHVYEYEHRLLKPSGEVIFLLQRTEVINDHEGNVEWMHGTARDITATKTTQLQLEKSERRLIRTLESIQDGFFFVDHDWIVTYWNEKAEALLGKKREDIIGKNLWIEYKEATHLKFYSESMRAVLEKTLVHFEEYFPPLDMWIEATIYPSEEGLSVYFKNITQRKQKEVEREQILAKNEEQHRRMVEVLEQMQDGFMTLSFDGKILYWNQEAEKITSFSRNTVLGKSLWEVYPDIKETPFYNMYQRLLADHTPLSEEVASPQSKRQIKLHAYKTQSGISVFFRDITETKKAEEELFKLSLIAKQTSNAVSILDNEMRIQWVNDAYMHLYGYSKEEVIGRKPSELVRVPEDQLATITQLHQHFHAGKPFHFELTCFTKKNKLLILDIVAQPVRNDAGMVLYYFVLKTDITDRKQKEQELRQLSLVAKETVNAVTLVEPEGTISWVNEAFIKMFGYSSEEVVGNKNSSLLTGPETDNHTIQQMLENFQRGLSFRGEILGYTKQKEKIWLETYGQPLFSENGKVKGYFILHTNISERKRLEKKINEQRKQTTAAVIAAQEQERAQVGRELHDNVNQILTSVKLYQELVLAGIGDTKELVKKSIELLLEAINENRGLSKRLSAPTLGNVLLKDSLKELVDNVANTKKFSLALDLSAIESLVVEQDLHLALYRILQEQLTNIMKYANASQVLVFLDIIDNKLTLKVSDNGIGFDTNQKRNGLGITNMLQRAESLNGELIINSAPGLGCVLIAQFPLSFQIGS